MGINVKFYFHTFCGASNGLLKAMKELEYHKRMHIYGTLLSIRGRAFGEDIYWLKVAIYFSKKISILDAWQGSK